MSVTIILQQPNAVTIAQEGATTATVQQTGAVNATITQTAANEVTVNNITPNAVTVSNGLSGGGSWGEITGTITDQTDLVTYVDDEIAAINLGVTELNGLSGDLDLVAGSNITITPSGSNITIASTGGDTTPTLDEVTDEGATTANTIQVGGLTVTGAFKNYDEARPDIGAKQDNDLRGYGDGYISNKTIAYSRISSAAFNEEGAIRIKDNVFQTYIDGAWQDVVTNFRFREDANGSYELEHKPIGFTEWIEVLSGNSDLLGLNGLPITQNYATSMGAYPVPLQLDGGTF